MSLEKQLSVCVFIILLLNACVPDPLEVDGVPLPEEQVVVGSQLIPDQFVAVSLSRNFTALDAGPNSDLDSVLQSILITDVELTLKVNGTNFLMTEIVDGIYGVNEIPQEPGTKYTLSFTNPINGQLSQASTEVLPFIGFSYVKPEMFITSYDTLLRVGFSIQDPPGANWYMLNIQQIGLSIDLAERPFTQLYDDNDVNDGLLEDEFTVLFREFESQDSVLISMANISREYFEFLELRNNQQFLLLDALGEPVNYPTNVSNGLGFFNVHIPDIRFFILDDL